MGGAEKSRADGSNDADKKQQTSTDFSALEKSTKLSSNSRKRRPETPGRKEMLQWHMQI